MEAASDKDDHKRGMMFRKVKSLEKYDNRAIKATNNILKI